ncbi:enoyl-CoA hydratase/isomerase family protein [Pseudooceanicola sp. 200-1SW]|uniref:enoyl-CoA hydratase/isomerase family protein n=1 Tax=Pseudooceanicola sp. 200-1SW TaxID=3425949 RepID=UPI003D7FFA97
MQDDVIEVSVEAGIGRITFNRPGVMNAIDVASAEGFRDAMRAFSARDDLRVIVLAGAGRAFIAGGDLAGFWASDDRPGFARAVIGPMHEGLALLAAHPAISVSVVQGAAAGGGMSVALAADLCLAGEGASFSTAYAQVAAPGDCGMSWELPRMVGPRKALELMLLSPRLSAAEAAALGLVNRVVPAEALAEEAERLIARLARGPARAQAHIKDLIRRPRADYAAQLDAEQAAFADCAGQQEFDRALAAFFDKGKES